MMQYASSGVRATVRKATNALSHGGHNGPGNPTSKSLNVVQNVQNALHPNHAHPVTRPNPGHQLFTTSKNLLQSLFTHLTAPGLRAPTFATHGLAYGARSLHGTAIRANTIQQGLSLSSRQSLQNHALRRQANMFLPRGPAPARPRMGGVAEVGIGAARNFSSARPIFEQLAQNVPIAARALYEVDWDVGSVKAHRKLHFAIAQDSRRAHKKPVSLMKPRKDSARHSVDTNDNESVTSEVSPSDIEHYFPEKEIAPVVTYLLIPLAPTPTARQPLPMDLRGPGHGPALLPSMSHLGAFHASHSLHALRVSTLFTRLDQANVWEKGVKCSAYSQGGLGLSPFDEEVLENQGVCTVLKLEFEGWSYAEVRAVIGESGSGWCVMEEVRSTSFIPGEDDGFDTDSLASSAFEDDPYMGYLQPPGSGTIDPSQSLVLPTLDFSSSFGTGALTGAGTNTQINYAHVPPDMENDPWLDEYSPSSKSFSYSDLSDTDFGVHSLQSVAY
ncbi:hypothetical protein D9619_005645 [Psilocybe cf. subviscida]|uniref:Uncharacterized protein n=1 Tax=Psilocybe cf. subviscida TaxID=2480587 RepID=A0A8H5BW36_9AGAR|nr:hypothetical protein D9619_005645 [Psilocybe cf. subviscida]